MEPYLHSFYTVRFSDCDPFRHLNNARYLDYFLNAREDHLRDHYQLDLADFYRKGFGWVVLQHEITYLRPASMNKKVCILTGLLDAGAEHLHLEAIMLDEEKKQLKALLHTRFVPISLTTGKRQAHPEDFLEFLSSKILPGLPNPVPTLSQRTEFWQQQVRTTQPA